MTGAAAANSAQVPLCSAFSARDNWDTVDLSQESAL